jgi:uncharacterized delta-60 repeat protein
MQSYIIKATPNAPGNLDTTFGNNGVVIEDIGGSDVPRGLALRSDNKIWVIVDSFDINFTSAQSYLLLYNSDGTLDTTFGTNGMVSISPINSVTDDGVAAIVLQPDGKIVIGGSVDTDGNKNFAVFRFTDAGAVDTTFGTGGVITTPVSLSADDEAASVAIQADGKIVAAGNVGNSDFALVRYEPDGSPDPTFGVGGIVTTNFPIGMSSGVEWANDVIIQSDDKIVAAGRSSGRFGVARYNTDGTLDSSFGNMGVVSTVVGLDPFMSAYAVAQQADGKLLVSGTGYNDVDGNYAWALVRYNSDGSLDTDFGTDGIVKTDFGGNSTSYDLLIRPNGKIVLVGDGSDDVNGLGMSIVQYNEDGTLDTSFGSGGVVHTGSGARAWDVIIQPDGKLVVLGYASLPPDDIFLARYKDVDLEYVYLPIVIRP